MTGQASVTFRAWMSPFAGAVWSVSGRARSLNPKTLMRSERSARVAGRPPSGCLLCDGPRSIRTPRPWDVLADSKEGPRGPNDSVPGDDGKSLAKPLTLAGHVGNSR